MVRMQLLGLSTPTTRGRRTQVSHYPIRKASIFLLGLEHVPEFVAVVCLLFMFVCSSFRPVWHQVREIGERLYQGMGEFSCNFSYHLWSFGFKNLVA